MDRNRLSGRLADLSVEQAPQQPQAICHRPSSHRCFALAVAGLAAFAAVSCLPAPLPGTASRPTGFPTGDPPHAGRIHTDDDYPPFAPDFDHHFDIEDWSYRPLDSVHP
jgi:hypothetical protein